MQTPMADGRRFRGVVWREMEICPEMHALAKMAINRQNRQTINKNSNEMAKGPFAKWQY